MVGSVGLCDLYQTKVQGVTHMPWTGISWELGRFFISVICSDCLDELLRHCIIIWRYLDVDHFLRTITTTVIIMTIENNEPH